MTDQYRRQLLDAMGGADTIVARATAPGRSAIAMVRMSGPDAFRIAGAVTHPWPLEPRRVTLCTCVDPVTGSPIDHALTTAFIAPRSYTGEPMVEFSTHGGDVAPILLLRALISAGAREASRGEFTRRAVLGGKMDLIQAEAIGDIVDARTRAMHRAAMLQLDGGMSERITMLRHRLLDIEVLLGYDIDFPEEDDGPISRERVEEAIASARTLVRALLDTAPAGDVIRCGATVVIAGLPNAGKSSLFNALLGEARALVTEIPGTTRDAIEGMLDIGQWPICLVDTAGLRTATDVIERLGIEVAERYLGRAAVILLCVEDVTQVAALRARVKACTDANMLEVVTKCDLRPPNDRISGMVYVSANSGEGLRPLMVAITRALEGRYGVVESNAPMIIRERHRLALEAAMHELDAFAAAWRIGALPAPVAAVHLRSAISELEVLIGGVEVEEILGRLFSTFCIGK